MKCHVCDAQLSRYHEARSDLCRLCDERLKPLSHVDLTLMVEAIMLEALARHDGGAIDLRRELERRGVRSTAAERDAAVRRARERRIVLDIDSDGPHAGYRCLGAEQVFIPRGTVGNRRRPSPAQLRLA